MGVNTCGVKAKDGTTLAIRIPDYPTAVLMAAAPDMARALLAIQRCEVAGSCTRCAAVIRKVLQKAGVL